MQITKADIEQAQQAWANAIIDISNSFLAKEDYKTKAEQYVAKLYAFDEGQVLFKPTLAAQQPFRLNYKDTMSYFIGGHIAEDKGFAIMPWSKVRYAERHFSITDGQALSMGTYYFTKHATGEEVKVEFTFGYVRAKDGSIKIILHHSSVPFSG